MPAENRKHEPGVIDLLIQQPHRFQFAQLVSVLLTLLRRQGIAYESALGQVLRFRNSVSLAFPASEVEAIDVESDTQSCENDASHALRIGKIKRVRITPTFIGLLGVNGTLPLHDTERMAARPALDGDASRHELLDLFSNRVVGLFYEAWGKHRVEHGLRAKGKDKLLPMLMALAGAGSATEARSMVRDETTAYYAALLRTRPVCAASVERVLAEHLEVPVRLEQFVGGWDTIPRNRQSTLGTDNPTLGYGCALGTRLWRHDRRARLHVGPLSEEQMKEFLPG